MLRLLGFGLGLVVAVGAMGGCATVLGLSSTEERLCVDEEEATAFSDQEIRACILRASCPIPFDRARSISECLGWSVLSGSAYDLCTATAQTCPDVDACRALGPIDPADCPMVAAPFVCEGARAISCRNEFLGPYYVDCVARGGACDPGTSSGTTYACRLEPPTPCEAGEGSFCDGDVQWSCAQGLRYGEDCARTGRVCFEGTPGNARCQRPTIPCDSPNTVGCDGDRIIGQCDDNGRRVAYDCAGKGYSCSGGSCEPTCERAEDLRWCRERCLGDGVMRLCPGGTFGFDMLVDCRDYGFTDCAELDMGEGNYEHVVCR